MKNIIAFIILSFVFVTVWAEPSVSFEPLAPGTLQTMTAWNPEIVRLQAMNQVRTGKLEVVSQGMVGELEVVVGGENINEVLEKLSAVPLQFEVVNPEDWVSLKVSLWGDGGADIVLLSGFYSDRAKNWQTDHLCVSLVVNSIPVLAEVNWAEVLILNQDGSTWKRYKLRVKNGQVIVDGWLMGVPNATLVAYFNDGIRTYRLGEPFVGLPQVYRGGSSFEIANHYTYNDPSEINLVVTERPTITVKVSANDVIPLTIFDVTGVNPDGQLERPLAMVQVLLGEDGNIWVSAVYEPDDSNGRFALGMSGPGTFNFFFIWDQFGSKDPL